MDNDPRGALVYAEAIRTLDTQAALLENIQSRAGTLLSAASIATSFFAALTIKDGEGLKVPTVLASLSYIAVVAICVSLLAPRSRWVFRFDGSLLIKNCLDAESPPSIAKMHRDLSKQMAGWAEKNEGKLERMLRWFRWAAIALGVEVSFWIVDLVWRG